MTEDTLDTRVMGASLGVFVSRDPFLPLSGILIYNPVFGLVNKDMDNEAQVNSLNFNPLKVTLPYDATREVRVDGNAVWRNINLFSGDDLSCTPGPCEQYYGFGDVEVDFREDHENVQDIINQVIAKNIGLYRASEGGLITLPGRKLSCEGDTDWDKAYQVSVALHNGKNERDSRKLETWAQKRGAYVKDTTVPRDPHVHYLFKDLSDALQFGMDTYRNKFPGAINLLKVQYDINTREVSAVDFSPSDLRKVMELMPEIAAQGGRSLLSSLRLGSSGSTIFVLGCTASQVYRMVS